MAVSVPHTPRGYMSDEVFYQYLLADLSEQVPDLIWPLSVTTYAQMRRDPQLTAVLAAYTLPIRRATWQIDPTGCRPEVVQVVADDLGLPVVGDDKPGAARTRGVSWPDHIRAALLQLVYGHMGFAMGAEIRDGRARLTALSERMPHTITEIRIANSGDLLGINQFAVPGQAGLPDIPASQLLWYAHDREGAAWQGKSLLRPAYAPWLLKREMQRVLGTSNRRFGMGVPTVRALPGTTPLPSQQAEAALLAQAVRVGDQGGASIPPGYVLELIGLSGSVPDTLAFIRWLDSQISSMALASVLDLPSSPNGSRALADSLIDLLLMSLQSIAEQIADTVTRQVAARVVAWNWGDDEPVPRVTVGDVGSSHKVTAETIQRLVSSGALVPDPALDAYVRREWSIPERTGPYPAPPGAAQPTPPAPAAVAARPARAPRKPAQKPGQIALPIASAAGLRRDLTATEVDSGADFEAIQRDRDDALEALASQWPDLAAALVLFLAGAAGIAVATGALADLGSLTVPDDILADLAVAIGASMTDLAAVSARRVSEEAASQGLTVPTGEADPDQLAEAAAAIAAVIASGYANGAARQALLLASPGADEQVVADAVHEHLVALGVVVAGTVGAGLVAGNLVTALAMAQAAGRMATILLAGETVTLTASEVLDRSTCKPCAEIDGHVFADIGAALEAYPTGRYRACLGADRCRGLVLITAR